ncbi:hypothetical protein Cgig2_023697 [Carnegiea gigantea]|uniref:heme oxygenase (biliverdin-producing) n=1 Tax=Carnegiea gigantea TaxID=171969 RepID=A0A9Q1KJG2_9CARY|nr:hypothetical protein Cgig2_023697 [Carnegiea gigantea]
MPTPSPNPLQTNHMNQPVELTSMASLASAPQSQLFFNKPNANLKPWITPFSLSFCIRTKNPNHSSMVIRDRMIHKSLISNPMHLVRPWATGNTEAAVEEEEEEFVAEMRAAAMKLHTRDQAKEGEGEAGGPEGKSVPTWKPTIEGYLKFLVDSKLVYDALDRILEEAPFPFYAELRNTGLERSESLVKDLEWFKEEGYSIPEASETGLSYSRYLEGLGHNDPYAFITHFYNIYFGHSAGGRMIGKMVSEKLLNNEELEFYKYDEDIAQLVQKTRVKLNEVALVCLFSFPEYCNA